MGLRLRNNVTKSVRREVVAGVFRESFCLKIGQELFSGSRLAHSERLTDNTAFCDPAVDEDFEACETYVGMDGAL